MYKIHKVTPSISYDLPVTLYSFRQAKDALLTIKINYDVDREKDDQESYLFEKNRALCAFQGGDRHYYYIQKVQA